MDTNNISTLLDLPLLQQFYQTAAVSQMAKGLDLKGDSSSGFSEVLSEMMSASGMSGSLGTSQGLDNSSVFNMLQMLILQQLAEQLAGNENANKEEVSLDADVPSGLPVKSSLTQGYHGMHRGLDYGCQEGTPVKATMSGKVIYAGWNDQGYGNLVILQNGPYQTYYGHLSKVPVKVGDTVDNGSVIGISGNTGNSTGPHLHYEIRKDGVELDPTATST